jgi:tRNA A-37 threonylcarbamoyl transferase component Bud32
MNTMKRCSTCGELYAGDLCPRCAAAFAQEPSRPGEAADEPPLKPGDAFHGLEIVELLGRGGMGVVYKARQPSLDRFVALKILPRKLALDPDFQNRFIREAKALGSLSHPNIVAVHDFGAEAGLFFFVMEFVDGVNLRRLLRDRKLTPEEALKIVPQLCDALEYAHSEGIVHRDIKPENILVDRKGRVKIADFGLAKIVGDERRAHALTLTNMVMGTPHYMAPEQLENPKAVDHRADIYSMGVVFYEMLTGELPLGRFEPPSRKVQVDVRLDDVVLKALEKEPERRYQKASEIREDVTRVTSVASAASYSLTVVTPVGARRRRTRWAAGLGITAVLAAAVLAPWALLRREDPLTRLRADAAARLAAGDYAGARDLYEALLRVGSDEADRAAARRAIEECSQKLAQPLDLTPYFITENDRVVPRVLVPSGGNLVRNPFYAKEREEVAKIVNWLGLASLSPGDVRQAYLAVWYAAEPAYAVLDTTAAEAAQREFDRSDRLWNRWSYRKGNLLVLAFARNRPARALFAALVAAARKKLGLPEEPLDVPLENLKFSRRDLPAEVLLLQEEARPDGFAQEFGLRDGGRGIRLAAALLGDLEAARRREAEWARDPEHASALKVEVLRAGRTVAALSLWRKDLLTYERLAEAVREWMGLPGRRWDTVVPSAAELPDGFSFDRVESDTGAVLRALALKEVAPTEVTRAWRATLKPAGSIVLLEIPDSQARSTAEVQLNRKVNERDTAEDHDIWLYAVDAPDDLDLDALQNMVRAKLGCSPNAPRYVRVGRVRFEEKDLPPGYRVVRFGAPSDREDRGTLEGPSGTLSFVMKDYSDLRDLWADLRKARRTPADLLLHKDFLLVHVTGPEETWPILDALEATLRRRMRMPPPVPEDYEIDASELPQGMAYLERRLQPNPQSAELDGKVRAWKAHVDPADVTIVVREGRDPGFPDAERRRLAAEGRTVTRFAEYRKGNVSAVLYQEGSGDEAAFRALCELVRARLRLPR